MVGFCTYTPTIFLASDDCMLVQHCLQIPSPLPIFLFLQYRHLIPAPVNRTSASVCLIKHPWIACKKYAKHSNGPHSLRIKATFSCEAQATRLTVVYYALAAHAFSAGIKRQHCTHQLWYLHCILFFFVYTILLLYFYICGCGQ